MTVAIPPINQRLVDDTGCPNSIWYEKLKYLQILDPLSSIVFPPSDDTKSNVIRTFNMQSGTTYTLVLTDAGNFCSFSNVAAVTVTIPPNSSVAFPIGTQIDVAQLGAGKTTFAQGAGVTIFSLAGNKALSGQYAGGTLLKIQTNEWLLVGSLIP